MIIVLIAQGFNSILWEDILRSIAAFASDISVQTRSRRDSDYHSAIDNVKWSDHSPLILSAPSSDPILPK